MIQVKNTSATSYFVHAALRTHTVLLFFSYYISSFHARALCS